MDRAAPAPGETVGEPFQGLLLRHRGRTGLTQQALAARLGVHVRSIQAWEGGISYPRAEHLEALLAAYLQTGGLAAGAEVAEAEALWAAAVREASRLRTSFDRDRFVALVAEQARVAPADSDGGTPARRPDPGLADPGLADPGLAVPATGERNVRRQDWGEAPEVAGLRGRAPELEDLTRGVLTEGCRVVALLGLGGIGKTILAARLAHALAPDFDRVYWRSLRNAPAPGEWLAGAIGFVAAQRVPPPGDAARLTLLIELLREQRCLLVLDNFETVLQPGDRQGRYREGYAAYGTLLERLAESDHQSCLLLTSREAPLELGLLTGGAGHVRAVELAGLGIDDGRALLHDKGLAGDAGAWAALVGRYGGNCLALKVVGESIRHIFGGDIAAYLDYVTETYGTTFAGIRRLLGTQVDRLSALENAMLQWLAVEREPVSFVELTADLGPAVPRGAALEAMEALRRRSLLERGVRGATFTLQPVVLEYVTEQLVETIGEEIVGGGPSLLLSRALLKATTKDYVRRSQERLILAPLLARLVETYGTTEAVAQRLLSLLSVWRGLPAMEQGYGPGNVVNLLRLLRGHLRGVDLSRLHVRHAYLQEVAMHDASLLGAQVSETVLGETFDAISSLAISADGAVVVAGTVGGEVRAWRVADRSPLLSVHAHLGAVLGVALSVDGRRLASGGHDGTVRLWEVEGGRALAVLDGHGGAVWGVALSADGRRLASGGLDGAVRLWAVETETGLEGVRHLATLLGHGGGVYGVALSADGGRLASGGHDGTVRLWDAVGGRALAVLDGHGGGALGVALSADGRRLASGGHDGTVRLWEVEEGRSLAVLDGHSGAVWGVALSADGRRLASGGLDGAVRLWDAEDGRPLAVLQGHTSGVPGVALSTDGGLLASGSRDATVRLWEADGQTLAVLRGHTSGAASVAMSPDGRQLASGSEDGTVRLWATDSGRPPLGLEGHTGRVPTVAFGAGGRRLASGGHDGTVRLWETRSGRPLAVLRGHRGGVWGLALSVDGRLLASGGLDGAVRLWETESGRPLAVLQGHTGGVPNVALSADGRLLASSGHDGTVRLWAPDSGQPLAVLRGHGGGVIGIALSADGRLLASSGHDGTVRLWEAPDGRPVAVLRGHSGGVIGVALSPDARRLASSGHDATVRLWDTADGQALSVLRGHTGGVLGVAFSADGEQLASGSLDGAVKLWDTRSYALLRTLRPDRRYERLDITGLGGVSETQRAALIALGAIDRATWRDP